jgi:nucleoside-diphosphate-sugar epimerase
MNILVTGALGMIGSALCQALLDAGHSVVGVDRRAPPPTAPAFHGIRLLQADLGDTQALRRIVLETRPDRFIHLAALAHAAGESDLSWQHYFHANVECSRNLFAAAGDRPVLFASTVDVFGFFDGKSPLNPASPVRPVTSYARSKALAEDECRKLPHFDIFRFSPVYTPTVKRDIQKRYYLKYPTLAYRIGRGSEYEVLDIRNAVSAMVDWCSASPSNSVRIIKDPARMDTAVILRDEKSAGRARFVLPVPRFAALAAHALARLLIGRSPKTYLLSKAVHPLRTTPS